MREQFWSHLATRPRFSSWPMALTGLVVVKIVLSLALKPDSTLLSYSGIPYFFLLVLATGFAIRNGIQNTLQGRPFWVFLAIAYGLWALDQWIFLYYQFGFHMDVPDNSIADSVLFLHLVPLMAALATRSHRSVSERRLYPTVLNSLLLLIFWGFIYGYAVFPYQLFWNATSYAVRFNILYALENGALLVAVGILSIRVSSPWKSIYLHLLGASTLYALSSAFANLAIDSDGYVNGKLYGLGLTAAVCWFLWIPLRARQLAGTEVRATRTESNQGSPASAWAMLAVVMISIPIVWELSRRDEAMGVRSFRLLVAITAIVFLASAAFLKEYFSKSELVSYLGSANDRLRLAMESGKVVGWEWDVKNGRVSLFGDLKANFGIDSESYAGSPEDFYPYLHSEDREKVFQAATEAKRNHEPYQADFRVVWPDGTLRWVSAKGEFQYSPKGAPTRMLGTTVDISDRRRLETELLHSRDRISAIVGSSDDAIISKSLDGIILSWNAAAQHLFGYSEDEAIGQSITILIPQELHAEESEILGRLRAGERIEHFETVRVAKDGKKLDVSLTVSPVKDSRGMIVGATKIAHDISDRKRAERVLLESEDRFRRVANAAPVLIWMSGVDKLCTFFNQGWLNFTGRSLEQELGEGWASSVHPDDLQRRLQVYSAAFDARLDFQMEYRLRRFNGEYRWIVDFGVPRFESDGTFRGYIGSCIDITERKTSEESLHILSGRLIAAQEEERARIARELHDDFSQRLALLSVELGQLWKKLPESEVEGRASIVEMLTGTKEMSSDIHALSHQLHSSKLEHVGLVSALAGLCKEISRKYKIEVHFTASECPLNVPKDVSLCLFRVAQEALANVVKHSGSSEARVEFRENSSGAALRISDTGKGFDPGIQKSRAGIGIIGMNERLRLVGGRLSVRSEPLRGTEVIADVPLATPANEALVRTHAAGGVDS
jgi:PAS domain S-box-containing protein